MNVPKMFNTLKSFSQFLHGLVLSGVQLVDQNEANLRAEVCMSCHNNVASAEATGSSGCSTCNKGINLAAKSLKNVVIKDRSTPHDARLKACKICGCFNQLQVWFPTSALGMTEETINAYPTFCWKKQI